MTSDSLAVVTPSYSQDFDQFCELHRSVLELTAGSVVHHVIVPQSDVALFSRLAGPRLVVWSKRSLVPATLVSVIRSAYWVNLRHPIPPVRGWILQQIIKLAAAERVGSETLLLVDSDVVLLRPVTADTFMIDDVPRFYRRPEAVDQDLPRHVRWHGVARKLLGLPAAELPLPDYVTPFNVWDREVVKRLLAQVESVGRSPWVTRIGAQLHFSEWTLYGVFVDEVLGPPWSQAASADSLCHSYWDPIPLDAAGASAFASAIRPTDVAMMISAKSQTPRPVRASALAAARDVVRRLDRP